MGKVLVLYEVCSNFFYLSLECVELFMWKLWNFVYLVCLKKIEFDRIEIKIEDSKFLSNYSRTQQIYIVIFTIEGEHVYIKKKNTIPLQSRINCLSKLLYFNTNFSKLIFFWLEFEILFCNMKWSVILLIIMISRKKVVVRQIEKKMQ